MITIHIQEVANGFVIDFTDHDDDEDTSYVARDAQAASTRIAKLLGLEPVEKFDD